MYDWLSGSLAQGNTVITASRRLARELRQAYEDEQLAVGNRAWPTPDIQFVGDWLGGLLEGAAFTETSALKVDVQTSTVLWERCITNCMSDRLPGFGGIVRQCRQAWTRLQYWRVPVRELTARASSAEQKQFSAAARQYIELLSRHNWVDDAGLFDQVSRLIRDKSVAAPGGVCLAGFDRAWPALLQLLDALSAAGTTVDRAVVQPQARSIIMTSYDGQQAELRAAGAWARAEFSSDPQIKIAIVCPDLENNAARVVRLVREGLAPGWQYAGSRHRGSVNVSYGRPLTDFPAIAVALMLLRWVHDGLSSCEVSILLRSRSIVGGAISARCRQELRLRRLPDRQWSPQELLAALGNDAPDNDAGAWRECIEHIGEAKSRYRNQQSPAQWAELFDQLLTHAGWPGSERLDSNEFQLLNRWRDLLNELARLQRVLPMVSFAEAVSRLTGLANDTIFQPESEAGVLPVLGTLEAAGMEFDKIWVTGLDAGRWPAPGNPLAFVSSQLQRDYFLPDATSQDSLAFSRRVLERLLSSSSDVVLSWANNEEGVQQQPSPLLQELPGSATSGFLDPGWHAGAMLNSELMTSVDEDAIPPVGADEKISGGAYTVQRQATDPFSAFAYGRLRVSDLNLFQPGLSASIRGSVIHSTLSYLYEDRPSQSDINHWSDEEWLERIQAAAHRALVRYRRHADLTLRRIIDLELHRIAQMLLRFGLEERQRDNFRAEMIEQDFDYYNYGVRLSLRVDRVDRLDDESFLIIDYKTGAEKALLNRDGDLNDLQLMVYALAVPKTVGGLALINLDSRKISFKKVGGDDNWQQTFSDWSDRTEATIKNLARGDASVNMALNTEQARPLNVLSRFEELRRD